MELNESEGYTYTFSEKEHDDNSKYSVRMLEIEKDYYSSRRYENH